jgi:hypothetical protein
MISRPSDQSDAERAVMNFKHSLAVKVMARIVTLALHNDRVFPGDLPADLVAQEHRQGVVSNAWGILRSLEIIRPLSPRVFDDAAGIIAGKKQNPHPDAKGRMTMVYELADSAKARAWLRANSIEGHELRVESRKQSELELVVG